MCCPAHPHPLSDLPWSLFWSAPKCLESTSPQSRLSPLLLCSPHASCCYNVLRVLTALSGAEKGLISGTPAMAPCAPPPSITMTVRDPCGSICLLSIFLLESENGKPIFFSTVFPMPSPVTWLRRNKRTNDWMN